MAPDDPLLRRPPAGPPDRPRRDAATPEPAPRRRPPPRAAYRPERPGRPERSERAESGVARAGMSANRTPLFAAGAVLAVLAIAAVSGGGGSGNAESIPDAADRGGVEVSMTAPSLAAPIVVDTVATAQKTTIAGPITIGSSGGDVQQLQQRLTDLGFDPGPIDGQFGENTQQAVWAYKKLILEVPREELRASNSASQVTPDMWLAMQDDIEIPPRRPQGPGSQHMEIYLPEQVAIVFHADQPVLITHISSGELDETGQPAEFCEIGKFDTDEKGNVVDPPVEKAICAKAKTPGGVFKFYREVDGNRVSALGGMRNPAYFNYGIAVHGAFEVPLYPASHGCIRVNHSISEYFLDLVDKGDLVFVWGHDGKEPEQYSENERLPSFNYADPNATTTTSSTTSTTSTTLAPATTVAPTTTKPATTTTAPATTVAATTTTVPEP